MRRKPMREGYSRRGPVSPGPGLSAGRASSIPTFIIIRYRAEEDRRGEGVVARGSARAVGPGGSTCAFAAAAGPLECRCGDPGRYPFRRTAVPDGVHAGAGVGRLL